MTCRVLCLPRPAQTRPLEHRAVSAWHFMKSLRESGGQAVLDRADARTAQPVNAGLRRIAEDPHPAVRRLAAGFNPPAEPLDAA